MCCITFVDPVLALHFNEEYGAKAEVIGLYFFIIGLGVVIGTLSFLFLVKILPRRLLMHGAALLYACGYFLMGPSAILVLPKMHALASAGLAVTGLGHGLLLVPLVPEKMEAAKRIYPGQDQRISDLVSGIHNAGMSAGEILGPLIGSWFYEQIGFARSCDVMAIIFVAFTITHILVCDIKGNTSGQSLSSKHQGA